MAGLVLIGWALIGVAAPSSARAGPAGGRVVAGPFVEGPYSRVRVVAAMAPDGAMTAAVEIRLDAGYKTYWRHPGDSGVPPVADFSGSEAVSGLRLTFPVPTRFADGAGGQSWGYLDRVILPLAGEVAAGGAPARLAIALDYAVCGKMCIPVHADLSLTPATAAAAEPEAGEALAAARARVPVPVALFAEHAGVGIVSLRARREPRETLLTLVAQVPANGDGVPDVDAFGEAEGFLELLRWEENPAADAPGRRGITLHLRAEPAPGAQGRFGRATLTLAAGVIAIESQIDLDAVSAGP